MKQTAPLVSVLCPTFNQAPYIRQCLDGILAQQTPFFFEILINDDHSTDGTTEIIQEYEHRFPDRIRAVYQKENQFSQHVDIVRDILLPAAQGKYIAICEGDDYWIRPDKLEHQVALFEKDPEVGLVYTYFYKYSEKQGKRFDFHFHAKEGDVYADILASKCTIWYVTVMMRRDLMLQAPLLDNRQYFTGDVFWYYWITSHSKAALLREHTAVYRVLDVSVSHFMNKRKKIDFFFLSSNTRLYFIQHYPPVKNPLYGSLVSKKSKTNCLKYALAHGDYSIWKSMKVPLLPLMSFKKTIYWFLRVCCHSEKQFLWLSELYNRYLDKITAS